MFICINCGEKFDSTTSDNKICPRCMGKAIEYRGDKMYQCKVQLNNDMDVENLFILLRASEHDVTAKTDRWIINGKSLLGLMALAHEQNDITICSTDFTLIETIKAFGDNK